MKNENRTPDQIVEKWTAEQEGELSFRSAGKEIENDGKVSLILQFATIDDMLKFRDAAIPNTGIRARDAIDDDVYFNRQFIAQKSMEESVRVTRHITAEV